MDKCIPEKEQRCSNCLYNRFLNKLYVCNNPDSDLYLLKTGYNYSCEYWNGREKEK